MHLSKKYTIYTIIIFQLGILTGCKKQLQLPPPYSAIVTSQVFADSTNAESALAGLYSNLLTASTSFPFGNGGASILMGLSSDEITMFDNSDQDVVQFNSNTLQPYNGYVGSFWANVYSLIYQTNAIIEGTTESKEITNPVKNQIIGEAKFFRAYLYFYMVNLFGDVPLLTTTDYKSNAVAAKSPSAKVYEQIVNDLKDAQDFLSSDYTIGNGERIRANKWAATALLARVYLFLGSWSDAVAQSTSVINSGLFSLPSDLDSVFLKNNMEAILQLQINSSLSNGMYNGTWEGLVTIPYESDYPPAYFLNDALIASFEPGDQRWTHWVDSSNYSGTIYHYAYKYKIGPSNAAPNAPTTEYYMLLRLAEQYLIRAEAKAQTNTDLAGAIADLNTIRMRAGLDSLSTSLNQTEVQEAVAQENRIEFFSEWGHRWLDLKRTGKASQILPPIKPLWQSFQLLYPIPLADLIYDPNLRQNQGYF